jgi:glycosyltransferase involved in cell wall biosynthesis
MPDTTKTLILLIPGFAENEADTTCLPAQQNLVKALNRIYPSLRVIVLALHYPFTAGTYQWHGNTVISLGGKNCRRFKRLYNLWKAWLQLRRLRKDNNVIGILSCWCGDCSLLAKYFSIWRRIKHHIWILGQDARATNKGMVKLIHPSPDSLIALSDFLVEEFYRNHRIRPQHVVPWGIDASAFPPAGARVDIDVIGVGNLIPLKQYDIFIEVIGKLREHMPGIRAIICGKGVEYDRLQALVEQLGLQDNVQLYGEKPHGEVLQLMQRSRILLHTSSYEGFGGVMAEALYAGAQVVSFVKPMAASIPRWHHAQDKEDMAAKALELLQQQPADRTPVLPYTIEDCARRMMQLYGYTEAITS